MTITRTPTAPDTRAARDASALLTDEMLARFDERAPHYDRENRFFAEDFAELERSGYLLAAVPSSLGGAGCTLSEVLGLQRRLAAYAPATAIAINMHLYWTGVAADLVRGGNKAAGWILEAAAEGHVFAAGHGERGNDVPLLASTTGARRVDGGWRLSGRKTFGSLSPVWTFLGVHAMDRSDPASPRVLHAFVPRGAPGVRIEETWDTMGMRATASHDTVLDDVYVPDEHVLVVAPAGFAGVGPFQLTVFAWGMLGFAAVYLGIADRAFDIAVADACRRRSISMDAPLSHHPGVQSRVADMRMAIESASALLERSADDWSAGVDHGVQWAVKLLATKRTVVDQAWAVVDTAMDLSGGSGVFRTNRMEQLFRDARLGRIHPGNELFAQEVVGKLSLGIDPDARPRWG